MHAYLLNLLSVQGVVGVISAVAPDVLCHAAVRARNSSVLLVACSDPQQMAGLAGWQEQQVHLQLTQVQQASAMCAVLEAVRECTMKSWHVEASCVL